MKNWISGLLAFGLGSCGTLFAATFTVNNIGDLPDLDLNDNVCAVNASPNPCTLRAAIQQANATPVADTIVFGFAIPTTLDLGSALPAIVERLSINGATAAGYNAAATGLGSAPPAIYIDGDAIGGSTADGFLINGADFVEIDAIGITGFPDNGIEVINSTSTDLDSNWIGVQRNGSAKGNAGTGIYLNDCTTCAIGQEINLGTGAKIGFGNLITNNVEDGIFVILGGENDIAGNWVGLSPTSDTGTGNGRHGIVLQSLNNRVGRFIVPGNGIPTLVPNQVGFNGGDGIRAELGDNELRTNAVFNNVGVGVVLTGNANKLGTISVESRNFIYENGSHGVVVNSGSTEVRNSWIWNNGQRGVYIAFGTASIVSRNNIYGNSGDAVRVDSNSNSIFTNGIGRVGASNPGNGSNGIVLTGNSNTASSNEIINLVLNGILLSGTSNSVFSNTIQGAGQDGVLVTGSQNSVSSNTINTAAGDGVDVQSGNLNVVGSNTIGSATGGADLGNAGVGIRVRAAATNVAINSNKIGFNADGIRLEGSGTKVCGNNLGFGPANQPAANDSEGIRVLGASNTIGNAAASCAGNLIGHNISDGIQVEAASTIIRDNMIGGDGLAVFGNLNGGILLTTGSSNTVINGNSLWHNSNDGVRVTAGTGHRIEFNTMGENGNLGIDLQDDGISPNDPGDPDTGPNRMQNTPVIEGLTKTANTLNFTYRVDTEVANANYPLDVDFYLTNNNSPQGKVWLVRDTTVAVNAPKAMQIILQVVRVGDWLTAMTTDGAGNSSEFSVPLSFAGAPAEILFKDGFED